MTKIALFRLAFTTAPDLTSLTLPHTLTRWSVLQKVRCHPKAPSLYKHKISGSISLPSRGSFHLSLMVLVHYRSRILFSLGEWAPQIQSRLHVSEPTQEITDIKYKYFNLRGFNPLWPSFPTCSFNNRKKY